ncbi:hypothetical protein [Xenorhabdus bovienii]|uniref:hypothetical protein n=1 Tax=Xenorhabdus bovienii TaxID=40576 RepID=UPI0004DAD9EE|nr:hypothetical protein [Xenorhabdus bovienii]CDG86846.1 exported hypothetical protein [Xenorhabdus bovienii str. feltiae France]CDG94737.1 exported hypothetical protein [Xenorhabdus bovienii str. feltiae Florida]
MKFKFLLTITFILSGCSSSNELSKNQISAFTNDEICKSLGKYSSYGEKVFDLISELEKRGMTINENRCLEQRQEEINLKARDMTRNSWHFMNHQFMNNTFQKDIEAMRNYNK